jgi:hypothetical protein
MRGYVYRSGRRRTGSVLPAVVAGIALGLALILGPVASAYATRPALLARPAQLRPPAVALIEVSHAPAVKMPPIAHAAGHKIA